MGKKKSALIIALMAALIVVLCFFSVVSFPYGDGINFFNSAVSMTGKDATLGGYLIDGTHYYGGGYSAVYYPEGVISSKQYEDDLAVLTGDACTEYEDKYVQYGSLYLEKETVCDGGTAPTEEFKASFASAVSALKERYGALGGKDVRLDVKDGLTVQIFLPQNLTGQTTGTAADGNGAVFSDLFTTLSYTGEFTVSYGSDASSATQILPENKRDVTIHDYVKSASVRSAADGTTYVVISFTKAGREAIKSATAGAGDSQATMFFNVGDNQAISLSVSEQIDQSALYISGGSLTGKVAQARAIVLANVLGGTQTDLSFNVGDYYFHEALFGNNALLLIYIAFGVCFVGMMLFFFIRYGKLGFAHLFSYLLFLFPVLLCVWAISFLGIGVDTVLALTIASVLLSMSNAAAYEYARKDYALGKTMASSVKAGYKKCFWHVFDLHVVIAILSFIVYGIGIAGLSTFGFVLGLATAFSGVCSLAINRLSWATMMAFTDRKGAFCRFKREEVEDDD